MKTKLGRRAGLTAFDTGASDVRHPAKHRNARKTDVSPIGLEKPRYRDAGLAGADGNFCIESRHEPLNRSSRLKEALASFADRMRLLTSAAMRFRERTSRILCAACAKSVATVRLRDRIPKARMGINEVPTFSAWTRRHPSAFARPPRAPTFPRLRAADRTPR